MFAGFDPDSSTFQLHFLFSLYYHTCFIFPCFMAFMSFIWHNSVWGFVSFPWAEWSNALGFLLFLYILLTIF